MRNSVVLAALVCLLTTQGASSAATATVTCIAAPCEEAAPVSAADPHEEDVRMVTADGTVCTPGETKQDDCNRCKCANNGIAWFCTRNVCPSHREKDAAAEETEEVKRRRRQLGQRRCTPGQAFYDGCNWCTCGSDGAPLSCTLRYCPNFVDLSKLFSSTPRPEVPQTTVAQISTGMDLQSSTISKRQISCTPGQTFFDGCNTCGCGPDGKPSWCTFKLCHNVETSSVRSRTKRDTTCTPGETFFDGCNNCGCGPDGKPTWCTQKACFKKPDLVLIPVVTEPTREIIEFEVASKPDLALIPVVTEPTREIIETEVASKTKREIECEPGQRKKIDCNDCFCANGAWACTQKGCIESLDSTADRTKRTTSCTLGQTFFDGCNTCECGPDGKPTWCTKKACVNLEASSVGSRTKRDRTCTPGETFFDGCNTCGCGPDGKTSWCTLKACFNQSPLGLNTVFGNFTLGAQAVNADANAAGVTKRETTCTPGQTFFDGCNTCECGPDGKPTWCTKKACIVIEHDLQSKPSQPSHNLKKRQAPAPGDPDFTCTPRTHFRHECNHCICASDGVRSFCTDRLCHPQEEK